MFRLPLMLTVCVLPLVAIAGASTEAETPGPFDARGPRLSAIDVLEGRFRWGSANTRRPLVRDEYGFATDRLYAVPAPGQHPRILFSAADLPRIRRQLGESAAAGKILSQVRERVAKLLDSADRWESSAYRLLVSGDIERFAAEYGGVDKLGRQGPPGATSNEFYAVLTDRAFLALVDEDEKSGKEVAAAIANFSRYLRPKIEEAAKQPGAENYWLVLRNMMPDGAGLGFMYDFAFPFMTAAQAAEVRGTIALAIKDRYGLGMNLPHQWRNWNFIGMGVAYPLMSLAIEGEEGDDPRIFQRGAEVANDYVLYGVTENGVGKEAVGYHTMGMAHTAVFGLAMANRGDNIFTLRQWRQQFESWLIWTQQPYGGDWLSSGDLGTFPPADTAVRTNRFFYPGNERLAYVAAYTPRKPLEKFDQDRYLQLLCPDDLTTPAPAVAAPGDASGFGLPTTLHDSEHGVLFARTGWKADDTSLQLNCRSDTTFPSHDFADRGSFYLTALGQAWAVTGMRETETKYNNCITIDGRGQGYFATPGKWLSVTDTSLGTFAAIDTKYCYDWQWQKTSYFLTDEQLKRQPWLEWTRAARDRLLSRFPIEQWEHDPLPQVRAYNEPFREGNPRMWGDEDAWVVRAAHFPVQRSFRTVGLVRGKYPYVLICDDIQKDDTERLYQWRMTLPLDVEPYTMSTEGIVLGKQSQKRSDRPNGGSVYKDRGRPVAEKGQPMLLVRVVSANQPSIPALGDNATVETLDFLKVDDIHQFAGRSLGMGRRLVIPSRSVAPDYKILLIPFRSGEAPPKTTRSPDGSGLTVEWADQVDRFTFSKPADGRTRVRLDRNGEQLQVN